MTATAKQKQKLFADHRNLIKKELRRAYVIATAQRDYYVGWRNFWGNKFGLQESRWKRALYAPVYLLIWIAQLTRKQFPDHWFAMMVLKKKYPKAFADPKEKYSYIVDWNKIPRNEWPKEIEDLTAGMESTSKWIRSMTDDERKELQAEYDAHIASSGYEAQVKDNLKPKEIQSRMGSLFYGEGEPMKEKKRFW